MTILNSPSNLSAERAVLAGVAQFGKDGFITVCDILNDDCFTNTDNQIIYRCITEILSKSEKVDIPSIIAIASQFGFTETIQKKENLEYIRSLFNYPALKENIKENAIILRKLGVAREGQRLSKEIHAKLSNVTGREKLSEIVSMIESPILNFSLGSESDGEKTEKIGTNVQQYIDNWANSDNTSQGVPSPWKRYNEAIGGGRRRGGVYLIASRPKAQPLDAKVATPSGWKLMGDLKVGDDICHPSGKTTKIVDIIPQGQQEVFRFTFDDNVSTTACGDHLWKMKSRRKQEYSLLSYNQIKHQVIKENDRYKWQFPLPDYVEFAETELFIDPYILGVLIGDGCILKSAIFTSFDEEIVENVRKRLPDKIKLSSHKERGTYRLIKDGKYYLNPVITELKKIGLLGEGSHGKFIPYNYLCNSYKNRLDLFNGLMDTDGTAEKNGLCTYSTVSERLRDDIIILIRSLGGKAKYSIKSTSYDKKTFFKSYHIRIAFNDPSICFKLTRKKNRCHVRTKPDVKRKLTSVESIGYKETQCITVDNPDGLYITDDFIVTHNCGKSSSCINDAIYVSKTLKIPVLYLDTEMTKDGQLPRIIANLTNMTTNDIETGQFSKNGSDFHRTKVKEAGRLLEALPLFYRRIAGKPFEEVLSIILRFIKENVGVENGRTKDCLVIYDYFKLMDMSSLKDVQEYQAIGFQISALTDFCSQHEIPCSAYVQLNRQDDISQSDRLLWLCSSYAYLQRKTYEELILDGPQNGNTKFYVTQDQRYGAGLDDGDYINLMFQKDRCIVNEGLLKSELARVKKNNSGFETIDDQSDDLDLFTAEEFDAPAKAYRDSEYRK